MHTGTTYIYDIGQWYRIFADRCNRAKVEFSLDLFQVMADRFECLLMLLEGNSKDKTKHPSKELVGAIIMKAETWSAIRASRSIISIEVYFPETATRKYLLMDS